MPIYKEKGMIPPHLGHDRHLCSIVANGLHLDDYTEFVKNPKFVGAQCGRVAAKKENFCEPMQLD